MREFVLMQLQRTHASTRFADLDDPRARRPAGGVPTTVATAMIWVPPGGISWGQGQAG